MVKKDKLIVEEYEDKVMEIEISEENIEGLVIPNSKIENCKVLWIKNSNMAIEFQGFGINVDKIDDINSGDMIKIEFEGEIGKSNFKIISINK